VGGDEATLQVAGDVRYKPTTRDEYVSWGDEDDDESLRGSRFRKPLEPYAPGLTPNQGPGPVVKKEEGEGEK